MSNLATYFEAKAYKPRWHIGDRVFGHWNGIPFVGSVGNDRYINDRDGAEVTVTLDLPIRYQNQTHHIVIVKHKNIKAYQ